jgi:TRAP-type C4-dicarboxylate transport system permease small subunit
MTPQRLTIGRLYDRVIDALAIAAAAGLAAMALYVSYEVAARYFFGMPTNWTNDLAEYTMVWATFLLAPWLVRTGGHISIEILVATMPPKTRRAIAVFVELAAASVCAIACWQTWLTTADVFARGLMIAKTWSVPLHLLYLPIPIGFGLMAVEFLRRAFGGAPSPRAG